MRTHGLPPLASGHAPGAIYWLLPKRHLLAGERGALRFLQIWQRRASFHLILVQFTSAYLDSLGATTRPNGPAKKVKGKTHI